MTAPKPSSLERQVTWNRRVRAYLAWRRAWTRFRAKLLGAGLSIEAPQWSAGVSFFEGGHSWASVDGAERKLLELLHCPICAAYVRAENRAYHERWHIIGSV